MMTVKFVILRGRCSTDTRISIIDSILARTLMNEACSKSFFAAVFISFLILVWVNMYL